LYDGAQITDGRGSRLRAISDDLYSPPVKFREAKKRRWKGEEKSNPGFRD